MGRHERFGDDAALREAGRRAGAHADVVALPTTTRCASAR
jgi:hypothetical protein